MLAILRCMKKSKLEVAKEELKEALSIYKQAEQNFNYAEGADFIDKAIYDLKSAEIYLTHILQKTRSDIYGNKLINAGTN